MTTRAACVLIALAALPSLTSGAQRGEPGSLLLFPEYHSQPGVVCLVTVTNSDELATSNTIGARWTYIDGSSCSELNFTEILTPGDTVTVDVSAHVLTNSSGYLYVYATESSSEDPITHNHLIGHASVIDGIGATSHAVEPYAFGGIASTDLNQDGLRNLDGREYQRTADQLLVPRFFGQGTDFQSELVIVDLTGGAGASSSVEFLIYNDNEEAFSASHAFSCWTKVPLSQVSGVFDNSFLLNFTNHDPAEYVATPGLETGWFRVDGGRTLHSTGLIEHDPAILVQLIDINPNWRSALPPSHLGFQTNGAPNPTAPPLGATRRVSRTGAPPLNDDSIQAGVATRSTAQEGEL